MRKIAEWASLRRREFLWAAVLAFGSAVGAAQEGSSDRYGIGSGKIGSLAILEGRVFFARSAHGELNDLWRIERKGRGFTIRPFSAPLREKYLVADGEGGVTLSKTAGEGSIWSLTLTGLGSSETTISLLGEDDRRRYLTADERPTTFAGHDVRRVTLSEEAGPRFSVTIISP